MSGLTLIGDLETREVRVALDTLESSSEDGITEGVSASGQKSNHVRYDREVYTVETSHYTQEETDDLEDFLISNSNIVDVEGSIEGTFDVIIRECQYAFFVKNNTVHTGGQKLILTLSEESDKDKYIS